MKDLNEKIKTIAVYDGWLIIPEGTYTQCHNQTIWFGHGGSFDCYHDITAIGDMKYTTSFDWLIPVAKKVCKKLDRIDIAHMSITSCIIKVSGYRFDINDLFEAVYNGIVLLNETKTKKDGAEN